MHCMFITSPGNADGKYGFAQLPGNGYGVGSGRMGGGVAGRPPHRSGRGVGTFLKNSSGGVETRPPPVSGHRSGILIVQPGHTSLETSGFNS